MVLSAPGPGIVTGRAGGKKQSSYVQNRKGTTASGEGLLSGITLYSGGNAGNGQCFRPGKLVEFHTHIWFYPRPVPVQEGSREGRGVLKDCETLKKYNVMKEKSTPSYYAIIPASVRYDNNLPAGAKLLYGEITALSNQKGYCFASNGYFSNLYRCTPQAISKWFKQLEKYGHVKIEYHGNTGIQERRVSIIVDGYQSQLRGVSTGVDGVSTTVEHNNTSIIIQETNSESAPAKNQTIPNGSSLTPSPDSAPPPSSELPPEELAIRTAIENANAYMEQWPAMRRVIMEGARLRESDIDFDAELESWIRHHATHSYYLANITKSISSDFARWMVRAKQFNNGRSGKNISGGTPPRKRVEAGVDERAKKQGNRLGIPVH